MKKGIIISSILVILIGIVIIWSNADTLTAASFRQVNPSPSTTVLATSSPTEIPTASSSSTPSQSPKVTPFRTYKTKPTATPPVYQNYGWYIHDGQSMQYLNGSWFYTPQQDVTPSPSPKPTPLAGCPDPLYPHNCEGCKRSGSDPQDCEYWLKHRHDY